MSDGLDSDAGHPREQTEADRKVEQWFIDRGVPHLIRDYSATEDIFTRAFPFLAFVMFAQLFLAFTKDYNGWSQAGGFLAGVALFGGAFAVVNKLRGREPFSLPSSIDAPELAIFVFAPALLRALSTGEVADFWTWAGINIGILLVAYLVTSYGLFPMIPWAFRQMARQLGGILSLFAKSLPLLLLFSAFLFVNAEIWQVANDIPPVFFVIVIAFLVLVGSAFIVGSIRHTLDDLNEFASWDEVCELSDQTPVAEFGAPSGGVNAPPLTRGAKINLGLLVFVAQAIQVLLVALMVAAFYIVFGLLTVRDPTILQWTTAEEVDAIARFRIFGEEMVLSQSLAYVAGFIAAFSGLQFAVSVINDETYRREFTRDMASEVRQALAARCRYLAASVPPAS